MSSSDPIGIDRRSAPARGDRQALGGLVIERYDYTAGFRTAAAITTCAAVIVWAGRRRRTAKDSGIARANADNPLH